MVKFQHQNYVLCILNFRIQKDVFIWFSVFIKFLENRFAWHYLDRYGSEKKSVLKKTNGVRVNLIIYQL